MRILILMILFTSISFAKPQKPAFESAADKWNIRTNPIGLLVGLVDLEVDYAINNNFAVGVAGSYWNASILDFNVTATGFGIQGTYFLNPMYTDSWYLLAGYANSTATVESTSTTYGNLEATANIGGFQVGGGYHWFWDSFNLNLGLSTMLAAETKVELKDSTGVVRDSYNYPTSLGLDFRIGFKF